MRILKKGPRAQPKIKVCSDCGSTLEIDAKDWIRVYSISSLRRCEFTVTCPVCNYTIYR